MTFLTRTHNTLPLLTPDRAAAGFAPEQGAGAARMWAVIAGGLMWMLAATASQHSEGGARRGARSPRYCAMIKILACLLSVMPGSFAGKYARFSQITAHVKARMEALLRRYAIWRQRKCWMWGGGFMNPVAGRLSGTLRSSAAARPHDALIPD